MLKDLSACSFFIMCLMCKIMEVDNPGDPAADPAGSCEVSTPHAVRSTKGAARASDSQAALAFCNFPSTATLQMASYSNGCLSMIVQLFTAFFLWWHRCSQFLGVEGFFSSKKSFRLRNAKFSTVHQVLWWVCIIGLQFAYCFIIESLCLISFL